jgi:hypothetical protein
MSDPKYVTKDSGHRQVFGTGAQRDRQEGKGRYDLLPATAIKRVADIFERGAIKYADRNWEKGMPLSRFVDSAMRHLFQYLEGRRDEDHAGQACWNLVALLHTETMIQRGLLPAELNDLPTHFVEPQPVEDPTESFFLDPNEELPKGAIPYVIDDKIVPYPPETNTDPDKWEKLVAGDKVGVLPFLLGGTVMAEASLPNTYNVHVEALRGTEVFHASQLRRSS